MSRLLASRAPLVSRAPTLVMGLRKVCAPVGLGERGLVGVPGERKLKGLELGGRPFVDGALGDTMCTANRPGRAMRGLKLVCTAVAQVLR
jgi:hypothetical protein